MLFGALFQSCKFLLSVVKFHVESQLSATKLYDGKLYGCIFYFIGQKYKLYLKDEMIERFSEAV